jgi:hypothetical protein
MMMKSRIFALMAAVGICAVVLAPGSMASRLAGAKASTGLLSLTPGHVAIARVADVGTAPNARVPAVLAILDGKDQVLATVRGEIAPGEPLEVELGDGVVTDRRLPVKAQIVFPVLEPSRSLARARLILTFEMMNTQTLDIAAVTLPPICFPGRGGVEFNCEPPPFPIELSAP